MNEIEYINASLEKSNLILKKFKLLKKNNYSEQDEKSINVANELVVHLKSTYSFKDDDIKLLIKSYLEDEEKINALGGGEIASFIANCLKNILKED